MGHDEDLRTAHAAGVQLKETFDTAVKRMFTDFVVDLMPPEESSGGVRMRQAIRLSAKDGRTLDLGAANASEGTAELRTLGCTLALSQQRYGDELAIPVPEYARFVERATDVLKVCGLDVTIVSTLSHPPPK